MSGRIFRDRIPIGNESNKIVSESNKVINGLIKIRFRRFESRSSQRRTEHRR
jgi:hypothetical protein